MIEFVKLLFFFCIFKVLAILTRNPHELGWAGLMIVRIEMDLINLISFGPRSEWVARNGLNWPVYQL